MIRAAQLIAAVFGAAFVAVFGKSAVAYADDSPLRIRNLAPASGIYGEPRALGGDVLATGYELTLGTEFANNFTGAAHDSAVAYFDGETTYLTVGLRHAFAGRWEWGIEAPYVIQHGGYLDSVIDNFHDALGFDDNGRNAAERDKIRYFVADGGSTYVDFRNDRRGWGDIRISGGYQLARDSERSLALRALVKVPTGDVGKLTGSEATDVSAWLDYTDRDLLARLHMSMTGAVGVIVLGDGELLPHEQQRTALYGHFGVGYPLTDAWTLKAQLDYHSDLIDAAVDQLGGAAVQGSLGARWRFTQKLWTDFALTEDLTADSTSDVLLQLVFGVDL